MEDKTFELMTKMYSEMQDGFKRIDGEMQDMKENMATKDDIQEVKQSIVRLETEHGKKLDALADGYVQSVESINKLQQEVEKLTDRVEHQEIKLQVIKGL